ncbi:MAG: PilT/PilU family type 4a pilus ATPase [Bacteriovoracaceae bacterium]|nr:PilT/PilU family type 4a pilus ATPase [Bacteriovoracaceae bacterium]
MAFTTENLVDIANLAFKHKASDIHIRSGEAPNLRINGSLVPVKSSLVSFDDTLDICALMLGMESAELNPDLINELDGSFEVKGVCRFRYNIFKYSENIGIVLRVINAKVPSLEELNAPPILKEITNYERGLILVTGSTGSGKTTTLAAMIDHINRTKPYHILTLEDPIEYLHTQKKARISQREIGMDSKTFTSGLRSALRQDPDVILIGEIRDAETFDIALKAAETGHLVLSTVHTTNSANTIGRLISMYEGQAQTEIRKRLSETLQATIGQRMLESKRHTVTIAQEIMTVTPGVKEIILGKEPLSRLHTYIEKGFEEGGTGRSQTFDQHLMQLVKTRMISEEEAIKNCDSEDDFRQQLIIT